jgi:hypothetical protein
MTSKVSLYNCLVTFTFWVVIAQEIRSMEGFYINNHHSVKCNNLSRTISSRIRDSEACLPSLLFGSRSPQDEARIESVKSGVAGGFVGAISLAPVAALHNIAYGEGSVVNGLGQWEFDTDMGVIQAALFAIVYRYCVRFSPRFAELYHSKIKTSEFTLTFFVFFAYSSFWSQMFFRFDKMTTPC